MIVGIWLATFLHTLCINVKLVRQNLRIEHVAVVVRVQQIYSGSQ